jgi:glycosyltransferase involved in cell wall biosynthesis
MTVQSVGAVKPRLEQAEAKCQVSVVIPCLNEAENIETCVLRARAVMEEHGINGEVVVVDNGSEDASADLAGAAGARVIDEPRRGYGRAYLTGFDAARGDYLVMIDADLTYDFGEIPRFVRELDNGAELVMGNRLQRVEPGAMSILSRIGNPILSGFLNLLYRTPINDAHCGMRAFRRGILPTLDLHSTGMEFASEMVIRAARRDVKITEVPIALAQRGGESKLRPFRDGWRHLRLMLVYRPSFVFTAPGVLLSMLGVLIMAIVLTGTSLFGRTLYIHAEIVGASLVIVGVQIVGLGLCGRAYGVYVLGDRDRWLQTMQGRFRLEHGLLIGGLIAVIGLALGGVVFSRWIGHAFGSLAEERLIVLAVTLLVLGLQIFFTSFLLSILGLRRGDSRQGPQASQARVAAGRG